MPKGLEVLIPRKKDKENFPKKEPVFWIEIKKIKPNPFQPRKIFNKKELEELADSIEKYGILQPLIAKKIIKDTKKGEEVEYQLISGERRLRAARIAGLKEVPVIVREIKKEDELPISLVENIQREDLNPIERAWAYKELIEKHNLTQKEVGEIVGKSRESIANTLRLLDLPDEIKKSIEKGKISEGHARALLGIKERDRMKIFKEIVEKRIPVRQVEEISRKKIKKNSHLQKFENQLMKVIGLENIKIKEVGGKIEVRILFNSLQELKEFLKKNK